MGRRRGFTLMEIVVCVVLISISTILVVSLIPEGVVSIQKAENVEMATMYATEVAEDIASGVAVTGPIKVHLNKTDFQVTITTQPVSTNTSLSTPARLMQSQVSVTWPDQEVPVLIATRWFAP